MHCNLSTFDGAPIALGFNCEADSAPSYKLNHFAKYFSNRWAFLGVFGRICTAHAQKLQFSSFRSKLWYCRQIRRPDFLYGKDILPIGGHLLCDLDLWPFDLHIHNTHTHHSYQQWSRTHYSTPHTLWALTATTILADAAVTLPSPKWPKMCRVGR